MAIQKVSVMVLVPFQTNLTLKMPPLLPLADYQRIYQVIYSVLESTGGAKTHRACIFFATAGMLILREHYKLNATLSVGGMALMVDVPSSTVMVYGRQENGEWTYDADGFHAWVQCDGWLIDFMSPIMGVAFKEDGSKLDVPRNMLQKRLEDRCRSVQDVQNAGEFFFHHDSSVAEAVLDSQPVEFNDLLKVCLMWYQKPPMTMPPMGMGGTSAAPILLSLKAPSIQGEW